MTTDPIPFPQSPAQAQSSLSGRYGTMLVICAALAWSFGGVISRFIETQDGWSVVFWRSFWACAFLNGFLFARDGRRGFSAFRQMGAPGLVVALCFTTASILFVLALQLTTVANVVMIEASVPLVAALIAWLAFNERVTGSTWLAIAAVITGVAIMVSESLSDKGSLTGNFYAVVITCVFATATVVTRRYSGVRMTPAVVVATFLAAVIALSQSVDLSVSAKDMAWLFTFGALNLGLGMALFVTGARLIPAANAALFGTLETVLSPVWAWLFLGETASRTTLAGGLIVIAALLAYLYLERRKSAA